MNLKPRVADTHAVFRAEGSFVLTPNRAAPKQPSLLPAASPWSSGVAWLWRPHNSLSDTHDYRLANSGSADSTERGWVWSADWQKQAVLKFLYCWSPKREESILLEWNGNFWAIWELRNCLLRVSLLPLAQKTFFFFLSYYWEATLLWYARCYHYPYYKAQLRSQVKRTE